MNWIDSPTDSTATVHTYPFPSQAVAVGVSLPHTAVVAIGRGSSTVTPVASRVPLLVTVIV